MMGVGKLSIGQKLYKGKSMNIRTVNTWLMRGIVAMALVAAGTQYAYADSTTDIVNALVNKGVLTEEEGELISKGRNNEVSAQKKKEERAWTNGVNIRGYVQNRNTTMLGGDNGVNLWSDRSVGDDQSFGGDKNFLIRRARIIVYGDVGDRLSYYIQPDFASSAGTTGNVAQLRDAYGDVYITKDKVHRIRVGQSKVPYGWENLQSSSNRLALDRVDALNSAVRDERDMGAFYYYTPEDISKLFEEINKAGLKHSGNYGMFGFGLYNGQGANRTEANDNYHWVARLTYPWKTESGQFYEAGIQAYHGQYKVSTGSYRRQVGVGYVSASPTIDSEFRRGHTDQRIGISFIKYPQPWGIQTEWNWGTTPALDIATNTIKEASLTGGYVQAMYMTKNDWGTWLPFVRWQYFDGANKAETNAPTNKVNDWEIGTEWQIAKEVELTVEYHRMNRNNLVTGASSTTLVPADYGRFQADALRVQLQYNF
jgi:polyhydroxyalkanoate synthesis regulator phasin